MAAEEDQHSRGLLDTSVFIAKESGRPLGELPDRAAISVITLAELHLGVLLARGSVVRARRLRTLTAVREAFEALPIDSAVAQAFAEVVASARSLGQRPKIMDTWIAATAIAHDLPLYSQDQDFAAIPRVRTFRV